MATAVQSPPGPKLNDTDTALRRAAAVNRECYDALAHKYESSGPARAANAVRWLHPRLAHERASGAALLEIGSADGYLTAGLVDAGWAVTTVESSAAMADLTRRNAPLAKVIEDDFFNMEATDGEYDVVLANAVIHLFPAPFDLLALAKVRQHLRLGGHAFVATTREDDSRAGFEFKEPGHRRWRNRYRAPDFLALIRRAGLTPLSVEVTDDPFVAGKQWLNIVAERR